MLNSVAQMRRDISRRNIPFHLDFFFPFLWKCIKLGISSENWITIGHIEINSFIPQISLEYLLRAWHCSGRWDTKMENETKSLLSLTLYCRRQNTRIENHRIEFYIVIRKQIGRKEGSLCLMYNNVVNKVFSKEANI